MRGYIAECITFILLLRYAIPEYTSEQLASMHGHLKAFGTGRPSQAIEEMHQFPSAKTFFEDFVLLSKPLVMRDAALLSPGFENWRSDNYFLNLPVPEDNEVNVETKKKENRNQRTLMMNFKEFVKTYNATDHYMVDTVPEFLL